MINHNKEFEGKSVVVTGAAAGMGLKITEGFLEKVAVVVAVDRCLCLIDDPYLKWKR